MEALLLGSAASPPLFNSIFSDRCRPTVLLRRSPRLPFTVISADKRHAMAAVPPAGFKVMTRGWPEMEEHVPEVEKHHEGLNLPEVEEGRVTPEELERMEAEAMEGKDEGRAPLDYDRRARIFYESSRVFGPHVDCGGGS